MKSNLNICKNKAILWSIVSLIVGAVLLTWPIAFSPINLPIGWHEKLINTCTSYGCGVLEMDISEKGYPFLITKIAMDEPGCVPGPSLYCPDVVTSERLEQNDLAIFLNWITHLILLVSTLYLSYKIYKAYGPKRKTIKA